MLTPPNNITRRIQKRYFAATHVATIFVISGGQVTRATAIIICRPVNATCRFVFLTVIIPLEEVIMRGGLAKCSTGIAQNLFTASVGKVFYLQLFLFFLLLVAE